MTQDGRGFDAPRSPEGCERNLQRKNRRLSDTGLLDSRRLLVGRQDAPVGEDDRRRPERVARQPETAPDHALTPEGLIQKADQAMYRVKERDKNGIEVAV